MTTIVVSHDRAVQVTVPSGGGERPTHAGRRRRSSPRDDTDLRKNTLKTACWPGPESRHAKGERRLYSQSLQPLDWRAP
jgi:hypothetical protein